VVFVYYGSSNSTAYFNVCPISALIGYYRSPYTTTDAMSGNTSYQPVRRFALTSNSSMIMPDGTMATGTIPANCYLESIDVPSGGTTVTLESLLPGSSNTTINATPIVIQFAQGLANGRLFYNYWGTSVMVNGAIAYGNNYQNVSDTYNFTISPRG
jgi:hypothetical protein